MGYYIKAQKINILLNDEQQEKIFNLWMNPTQKDIQSAMYLKSYVEIFTEKRCANFKDILEYLGFGYETKKKGIKLTRYMARIRGQDELFALAAPIITPGNFITFKGEDGAIMGWFFDGQKVIDYSSNSELMKLINPLKLKEKLENTLSNENEVSTTKPKMKV